MNAEVGMQIAENEVTGLELGLKGAGQRAWCRGLRTGALKLGKGLGARAKGRRANGRGLGEKGISKNEYRMPMECILSFYK